MGFGSSLFLHSLILTLSPNFISL